MGSDWSLGHVGEAFYDTSDGPVECGVVDIQKVVGNGKEDERKSKQEKGNEDKKSQEDI